MWYEINVYTVSDELDTICAVCEVIQTSTVASGYGNHKKDGAEKLRPRVVIFGTIGLCSPPFNRDITDLQDFDFDLQ